MATPMNEDLWKDGIPPYVEDNSKGYREYVDRIAKRVDEWIKSGGGSSEHNWKWVKDDGKSHLFLHIDDELQLTQTLKLCLKGTIDWGDGSDVVNAETGTSSSSFNHTYTEFGDYEVVITPTEYFKPKNESLLPESESAIITLEALKKAEVCFTEEASTAGYYGAFYHMYGLEEVFVTFSGEAETYKFYGAPFRNCYKLRYVKFGKAVVFGNSSYADGTFENCHSLISIEAPEISFGSATTTNAYKMLLNCKTLSSLPDETHFNVLKGVNSTGYFCGENEYLRVIDLTKSENEGTTYGGYLFVNMKGVEVLKIPSHIETISANAFSGTVYRDCYVYASTPPSLANTSNALQHIIEDAKIHIPEGTLATYSSATNWASYADYFVDDIEV